MGKQKEANPHGLYDMHGNVFEWCDDTAFNSYENAPRDGSVWISDAGPRVLRGGSWNGSARFCRSAFRIGAPRVATGNIVGFRAARAATK
jgi:formylglycine-generating enzyme required for sulfatase activity